MNERLLNPSECSFCHECVVYGLRLKDGRILCYPCKITEFFRRHLTLTDDFAGQPFLPMPWNVEIIRALFGTFDEDGLRQYQDSYFEVGKKNAKSTFTAALSLAVLIVLAEPGQRVYGAATAKEQARNVFRGACSMVRNSPELSRRLRIIDSTGRIVRRDEPESFYSIVSADGDVNDGLNPSFVIVDELHRWRTRKALELYEILRRGMIARKQFLGIDITTSGEVDESPLCWRRHEYCRQVNEGALIDPRFYGRIWSAEEKRMGEPGYWESREARVRANPSHEDNGGYLRDSVLADLVVKAKNDPQIKADYLRYHLNIWGNHAEAVIEMPRWAENHGGYDLRKDPIGIEDLIGLWGLAERPCYAGVDLSSTIDLTALSLVFPPQGDGEPFTILPFFWMPEQRVRERELKDKVPYSQWISRGLVTATPGEAVDYRSVAEKIRWAAEMFELRSIMLDPWNSRQLSLGLIDEGFTCVELRQGYQSLSAPTKKLLELYLDRKLRHANHPVLYWNASCLCLKNDGNDNVRPDKPDRAKDSKRIDGIAATINALSQAMVPDYIEVNVRSV